MIDALAYTSDARGIFKEDGLLELAKSAAIKNADAKISGYLFFKDNQFFQYLEGSKDNIQALMARIESDERHALHRKFELGTIPNRLFEKWSMRYVSSDAIRGTDAERIFHDMLLYVSGPSFAQDIAQNQIMQLVQQVAGYQSSLGVNCDAH